MPASRASTLLCSRPTADNKDMKPIHFAAAALVFVSLCAGGPRRKLVVLDWWSRPRTPSSLRLASPSLPRSVLVWAIDRLLLCRAASAGRPPRDSLRRADRGDDGRNARPAAAGEQGFASRQLRQRPRQPLRQRPRQPTKPRCKSGTRPAGGRVSRSWSMARRSPWLTANRTRSMAAARGPSNTTAAAPLAPAAPS